MPLGPKSTQGIPPGFVVAAGAMVGTAVRWAVVELFSGTQTISLLFLNVFGSLLIGLLAGRRSSWSDRTWLFAATGLLGGLTSFSSFAVDVASRIDAGTYGSATGTTLATVVLAVIAAAIGYRISRGHEAEAP